MRKMEPKAAMIIEANKPRLGERRFKVMPPAKAPMTPTMRLPKKPRLFSLLERWPATQPMKRPIRRKRIRFISLIKF